jgi:hypothetical protein
MVFHIGTTVVGPYVCWRIKDKGRRSSLRVAFRIFRCIGLENQRWCLLTPRLETSSLLSLHVDVWRLIFLKLSLPRNGVRRCSAPCYSILYVLSFFKNGTDLTMFVMPQVSYACLLLQKDDAMLMSVGVVVLILRTERINVLEGVFCRLCCAEITRHGA